jgi:NitT/TauT family transport system ATP-binding protein
MPTAGDPARSPGPLDVRIERKAFRAADGTETTVLRDLHFALAPGSFTCLIGPSGCGKTTTLRIILGLERAFEGSIERHPPGLRAAAVFQEPRLLPWRTVEQNVRLALPPEPEAAPTAAELDRLFTVLGLDALLSRYPSELSLGLARRVALARAFAVKPDLLLLDEPFVSLDEHTADRLRAHLLELWQAQGTTVLMVTHNLREAARLADRLLLLNGRPASLVGDVAVPLARGAREGDALARFLAALARDHPATVLA